MCVGAGGFGLLITFANNVFGRKNMDDHLLERVGKRVA